MGKVYYGEQLTLGRPCAIKVLDPHVAAREGDDFNKRFLLEASVSAKLKHPNVVTIFDYGETDEGLCYIAMEYLEGKTLAQEIKDVGPMPASRAMQIFKQICRALREAHSLGVVHRDMKPANIFLMKQKNADEGDYAKVLDFGLVKETKSDEPAAAGEKGHTQVGQIMGSPKYMAPEQIQGKEVDGRTDIYSTGAVLYAMITGRAPFEKNNEMATMMAHVSEPVPLMGDVIKDLKLPIGVEDIVYRCLCKGPEERFRSMEELLVAIKMVEQGKAPASASGNYSAITGMTTTTSGSGTTQSPYTTTTGSGSQQSPFVSATGSGSGSGSVPAAAVGHAPKKSGAAIAALFIIAAAVIGGVAFMVTQNNTPATQPTATATTVATIASSAPSASASAPPPVPLPSATLHVETDPPGAKVKEDMNVVCDATPCDIVYTGGQADSGIEHLLVILKADHKIEKRIVKADGKPLVVKLKPN
jgi:serine/threonine-protein kinase